MGNTMGRGVSLVFCAIFAVAFGVGGYWAGLRPLAETALAAWTVRPWQPVPAQVLDAQLKKHTSSEGGRDLPGGCPVPLLCGWANL